ncbi:MAG TPA: zf-HC2 domain-containing protein [Microthrixaceae bacterium]|nr:zf-HC2 domain-containing protein [Microthrixaceae bacterium]
MTTDWHVDDRQIEAYLADQATETVAASVEAHLLACARCRAQLSARTDDLDVDASWAALERRIDNEIADPVVRVCRTLGLPEVELRLVAPTASLKAASIVGAVLALAAAALLSQRATSTGVSLNRLAFLIVASLLPLVAVVGAIGTGSEPEPELARGTPFSRIRIAALRAIVALTGALAVGLVASLVVGGPWTRLSLWLIPALSLAALGVLGARLASPRVVVAVLGGAWVLGVTLAGRLSGDRLAAFHLGPQLVYLAIGMIAVALVIVRPSLLELRESS